MSHAPASAARRTLAVVATLLAGALVAPATPWVSAASAASSASGTTPNAEEKLTDQVVAELEAEPRADFWVRFADRADLAAAARVADWDERGEAVMDALRSTAKASQADTVARLESAGVEYRSFWVTNAVLVQDGTLSLAKRLAADPDVLQVRQTTTYSGEEPVVLEPEQPKAPPAPPAEPGPSSGADDEPRNAAEALKATDVAVDDETTGTPEWGVRAINAPEVWAQGITGRGITVANLDSGVDVMHPALNFSFRGARDDGTLDLDHNWLDTSGLCFGEVCDNDGHGTHTMGTIVGDDGQGNQIGVAPGARWIAANGCDICDDSSLLWAGEWMLAPTKTDDTDPDPSTRPHVVNNSWGSTIPSNDPWFGDIVRAWDASGIFSVWSNGNEGPDCSTAGSPGSTVATYSVGAYGEDGTIGSFSSRGPGEDGEVKPNIAAPGVAVRSSLPGGDYGWGDGTSMAAPHVTGAVALLWSAVPSLVGDIATTKQLLDDTSRDVDDATCGGTADDNAVWGEGTLDAAALVAAGLEHAAVPTGTLTGTVTGPEGTALAGATVQVDGPALRSVTTDADGRFTVAVPAGEYTLDAWAYGVEHTIAQATVATGAESVVDLAAAKAVTSSVWGLISDETGRGLSSASVTISAPGTPVFTGRTGNGFYGLGPLPSGTYLVRVEAGWCVGTHSARLEVTETTRFDAVLRNVVDAAGYTCARGWAEYRQADTELNMNPERLTTVDLPFDFPFYGDSYRKVHVSPYGYVSFVDGPSQGYSVYLPRPDGPNAAVYAFWDDLRYDEQSKVLASATTVDGEDAFVVEWRDVLVDGYEVVDGEYVSYAARESFSVTLRADGTVVVGYGTIADRHYDGSGGGAVIGIENESGTAGINYKNHTTGTVWSGMSLTYARPATGFVRGTVTDANDGEPVEDVKVLVRAHGSEELVGPDARTAADGTYSVAVPIGEHDVTIERRGYAPRHRTVTVTDAGQAETWSPQLATGIVSVEGGPVDVFVGPGGHATAEVTVTNTGSAPLTFNAGAMVDAADAPAAPAAAGPLGVPADGVPLLAAGTAVTATSGLRTGDDQKPDDSKSDEGKSDGADQDALRVPSRPQELYPSGGVGHRPALVVPDTRSTALTQWYSSIRSPMGVGYDGTDDKVWVSDLGQGLNHSYTRDGSHLGEVDVKAAAALNMDMATDSTTDSLCQIVYLGDGIRCYDPETGELERTISGEWNDVPWNALAYDPVDDLFYLGGADMGLIVTVAGTTHTTPGELLGLCTPEQPYIFGLAFNPTSRTLWASSEHYTNLLTQIRPADCATLRSVSIPAWLPRGLEIDATGALWSLDENYALVSLLDVDDPVFAEVPGVDVTAADRTLEPGESTTVQVAVDAASAGVGRHTFDLAVHADAGRQTLTRVPVTVAVSGLDVAVDAGGPGLTDHAGTVWAADQPLRDDAAWGWTGASKTSSTKKPIAGTEEDALFQTVRTGDLEYTFRDAPAGPYALDIGLVEHQPHPQPGKEVVDVVVNGDVIVENLDVAAQAGGLTALTRTVTVEHTGGDLIVQLVPARKNQTPGLAALHLTHRPDLG